ncbi:MAG: thiol-disulfide oxidoreductase DCC family protein [Desulfuromonadales bacterium]
MPMPVAPEFPLRIFFDGACPVCAREIAWYLRKDRDGRLEPVDISAADFDPQPYGVPRGEFLYELHAIDRAGNVFRGVEAFRAIWQAFPSVTTYRLLSGILGLPVVNTLARFGYKVFARLRPQLPGRKDKCAAGTCRIGKEE